MILRSFCRAVSGKQSAVKMVKILKKTSSVLFKTVFFILSYNVFLSCPWMEKCLKWTGLPFFWHEFTCKLRICRTVVPFLSIYCMHTAYLCYTVLKNIGLPKNILAIYNVCAKLFDTVYRKKHRFCKEV